MAKSRTNCEHIVAVKSFKLKGLRGSKKERLMSEVSVFLCMDHPHVARLLDVYETDDQISLVTECMEGGELFDRVMQSKRFSEKKAADAARQMLLALNYLHSNGMVHRDLKLENFLFDVKGGSHLKMIDFGFSKFLDPKARMKTSCGTLAYVAPEVLKRSYTSQCDLWSMGVIVFVLLSGHMPFHGESDEQIKEIKAGNFIMKPEHWINVSKTGREFTKALLHLDPNTRLTPSAALEHQWLKKSFQQSTPQFDPSVLVALRCWAIAPKLQRACMTMMAWSLTNVHHAKVREHFLALDKNHDGVISFEEVKKAFEITNSDNPAETKISEVIPEMEQAIQSQICEIRYSDFLAAMVSSHLEVDDDVLTSTFRKFDLQARGFVSSGDLRDVLGGSFEGEDVEALLREADSKRDGKLDYEEFVDYIHASRATSISRHRDIACSQGVRDKLSENRFVSVVSHDVKDVSHACCVLQ
jgi:calcium-dependent protein kinase